MSSSKVLILRDHSVQLKDSNNSIKSDSTLKINPLIYSSKSGMILKPEDFKKIKADTIVSDSLKKQ